ncbi:MAG: hypothetical protein QOE90_2199 [Thermoplasmata archaeon]|nr:hypothetical protein [Thermoplasmata archaeon]
MEPAHPLVEPSTRPRLSWRIAVGAILLAGLAFLFRAPALFVWRAWWSDPYYTHGLPVFLAAAGLAAWRLARAPALTAPVPAWALLGLPAALGLYLVGFLRADAYFLTWSFLALAAAVALATGRLRLLAAPLLLAALALPTPWTIQVCVWLQDGATAATAALLGLAGVPLERGLTTLTSGALAFEVTPACSGFQSAVSLLAVGAAIATLFPMSKARRRVVLALAVPLALALNVARLIAVVAIGLRWGADAAEGFFHGFSSALIFLAETIVLLAAAGLLSRPREARA